MTRIIPARGARGLWPWETLEQYMQEVDTFIEPFAALLMLAAKLDVQYIRDSE